MKLNDRTSRSVLATITLMFAVATSPFALGGHDNEKQASDAQEEQKADKVIVEPYETRPNPTHEVSLHDGRVYFLRKLEETEDGYILHTIEKETIEVRDEEVAQIKKLKKAGNG